MKKKVNELIQLLLKERVHKCKCAGNYNKAKLENNKIKIYCHRCGWGE